MKKTFHIKGMHCTACEKILEDEFSLLPGIKNVRAFRKEAKVEFESDRQIDTEEIKKTAKKLGYEACESPFPKEQKKQKTDLLEWFYSAIIVAIFLFFMRLIQNLGIFHGFDLKNSQLNYGVSFLVGVVASLSSCLAVVGGVIIAFSGRYESAESGLRGTLKPNLMFHAGRLGAFFALGGLLGFLGGELNLSGNFVSIYTVLIGLVMLLLGLNILGAAPSLAEFGVSMPKKITRDWEKLKRSNHVAAPIILGILTFFLPCGFTQSMQIFALGSGNFWTGAGVLFAFALGTLPVLLALGLAVSWTKGRNTAVFQKAAGMLVIVFSVYTLSSGFAIYGIKGNIFSSQNNSQNTGNAKIKSAAIKVQMKAAKRKSYK